MFEKYLLQFQSALNDEIRALRKSGGQKTFLSDGCYLGKRLDRYVYSFTADTELRFPDDTPVDLEYRGKKYKGTIVSIEGFELILGLENHLGDAIATAILFTAPWFLLEELKKRLEEVKNLKSANVSLALKLLGKTSESIPATSSQAHKILNKLEQQLGKPIEYNENQLLAIDKILSQNVSFIWGPPGTGKTKTLGMAVATLVQAGESVLVVAHSNAAVDVAMLSVAQYLQASPVYKNGLVLRYGVTNLSSLDRFPQLHVRGVLEQHNPALSSQIEQLEKQKKSLVRQSRNEKLSDLQRQQLKTQIALVKQKLQPLKEQLKEKEAELIRQANVVGCTLSKAAIAQEVHQRRFDAVVIDEASMAYIPHCAFISTLARRRVAVFGDFRQLGPISQADTEAAREWLQQDIFNEAGITASVKRGCTDPILVLLKIQYRK
ncbi:AAA domain-containing protein [Scytonema millei]|uniref:AAA family ATPase n=1 Tax=Scytonema millei VB511283 TaxID=1245923 RepID=A0A9X5E3U5_9CYAN|nr:AAA domain-containing protein [Scytonema millei]NHC34293.1 AAA family ATPase [Scytonema millei VB511283]